MAVMIDSTCVIRLFENNLFDYDQARHVMMYKENGLNIEFAVPWLDTDVKASYDLARVRAVLGDMMKNVQHTEKVRDKSNDPEFMAQLSKELKDFGMKQLDDSEFFGYEENGKAVFTVELEYLVSLLVINKNETVTSLLTAMLDDARGNNNGKETQTGN